MKYFAIILFVLFPLAQYAQADNNRTNGRADSLLNIPPVDRVWTGTEFLKVLGSLAEKQKDNSFTYPTIANNEKLFFKITTFEEYGYINQKDRSFDERITYTLNTLHLVRAILVNYYKKTSIVNGKLYYEAEIARLVNLLMKIVITEAALAKEFILSNPNLNQAQKEGHQKLIRGIGTMVTGSLITLKDDYIRFSLPSVCSMSITFKEFYTNVNDLFDKDLKAKFDAEIANLKSTHKVACVRTTLGL